MRKMKRIKLFESFVNEEFYLKGFKENMSSYVKDIDKYIDIDDETKLIYVNIPYDAVKDGIDSAEKIVAISQKYPKCKSAVLNGDAKEIRIIFDNK